MYRAVTGDDNDDSEENDFSAEDEDDQFDDEDDCSQTMMVRRLMNSIANPSNVVNFYNSVYTYNRCEKMAGRVSETPGQFC